MKKQILTIAGTAHRVYGFEYSRTQNFPGAGKLIASAIEKTSKNRYTVHYIGERLADAIPTTSLSEAVEKLQEIYNKYGCLIQEGQSEENV